MNTDLALLMLFSKLTGPRYIRPDLEQLFQCDRSRIARFIYAAADALRTSFGYTLRLDINRLKLLARRRKFARAIGRRAGAMDLDGFHCIGFIDCVFRENAKPGNK